MLGRPTTLFHLIYPDLRSFSNAYSLGRCVDMTEILWSPPLYNTVVVSYYNGRAS